MSNKILSQIDPFEVIQKTLKQLASESLQNGDWAKLRGISTIAIALSEVAIEKNLIEQQKDGST